MPISGADWQGFTYDTGARCNAVDPAVLIASSADSRVVVCLSIDARCYYGGTRTSDWAALEIEDPTPVADGFVANNKGTAYSVSSAGLVSTAPSGNVSDQRWNQYWTSK